MYYTPSTMESSNETSPIVHMNEQRYPPFDLNSPLKLSEVPSCCDSTCMYILQFEQRRQEYGLGEDLGYLFDLRISLASNSGLGPLDLAVGALVVDLASIEVARDLLAVDSFGPPVDVELLLRIVCAEEEAELMESVEAESESARVAAVGTMAALEERRMPR